MTRDEVIRLALKAGFTWEPINNIADPLESFAALVMEAKDGPWKAAVIDQLVVSHIYSAKHETDPLKAVQDLQAYHADIAVDPRVSGAAARLVEQAKAEEREACAKVSASHSSDPWKHDAAAVHVCDMVSVSIASAILARGQK